MRVGKPRGTWDGKRRSRGKEVIDYQVCSSRYLGVPRRRPGGGHGPEVNGVIARIDVAADLRMESKTSMGMSQLAVTTKQLVWMDCKTKETKKTGGSSA